MVKYFLGGREPSVMGWRVIGDAPEIIAGEAMIVAAVESAIIGYSSGVGTRK